MRQLRIASIQLRASSDHRKNFQKALRLAEEAVQKKADLLVYPEHFLYLGKDYFSFSEFSDSYLRSFQEFARQNQTAFLLGSIPERTSHKKKVFNTSYFINKKGKVVFQYRKKHLFCARLKKDQIDETRQFLSGKKNGFFRWNNWNIGVGICFDLRFAEVFQELQQKKTDLILLPAAFTKQTGKDHWSPLLKARAIESLSYVVGVDQFGLCKETGVHYYGKSAAFDPWGKQIHQAPSHADQVNVFLAQKSSSLQAKKRILLYS